jgi:hypothetical protein
MSRINKQAEHVTSSVNLNTTYNMSDKKDKELTPEQLEKISGGASSSSGYRSTSSTYGGGTGTGSSSSSSRVYGSSSSSYRSSR